MRLEPFKTKTPFTLRIGLFSFLTLFASASVAGNWKPVPGEEKTRVEIDVATLARDGNTVKVWERETRPALGQARPGDFFFKSMKSLAQHHCTHRTTTYLFRGYYAEDGSEIKATNSAAELDKVDFLVPDSPEERKLMFACKYQTAAKQPAKPLAPPAQEDKAAEPPTAPAKSAPVKPAEKDAKKDTPPAKSAEKDAISAAKDKAPAERIPEKIEQPKPAAATPPTGKTSAGK